MALAVPRGVVLANQTPLGRTLLLEALERLVVGLVSRHLVLAKQGDSASPALVALVSPLGGLVVEDPALRTERLGKQEHLKVVLEALEGLPDSISSHNNRLVGNHPHPHLVSSPLDKLECSEVEPEGLEELNLVRIQCLVQPINNLWVAEAVCLDQVERSDRLQQEEACLIPTHKEAQVPLHISFLLCLRTNNT